MRKLVATLTVITLGVTLLGCTPPPVPPETTSPPPTTPTPTPQFTEEEQAVIGAVDRFQERWIEITQNLSTADPNTIHDVAWDPAAADAITVWIEFHRRGLQLVGETKFIPDRVKPSTVDYQGQRYNVYGCYALNGAYLVDEEGTKVENDNTRSTARFEVIHTRNDQYIVTDHEKEGDPC